MKTLILFLFTLFLLADCAEKPRIKRKTTVNRDKLSRKKEDNRRTVGIKKRRSRSRSRSPSKTPEEIEAEAIEALKSATGLSTTIHNEACPDKLYPTEHNRFFANTLKIVRFDYEMANDGRHGIFFDADFFIRRIDVGTQGKALVHFKQSILQSFAGGKYTWFLYFEDNGRRDARSTNGHLGGDIQYKAIQFKVSEATETTDELYKFGSGETRVMANNVKVPVENAKTIGPHVLEFIANVNTERGRAIRGSKNHSAEIIFAIGTSNKCIEVYDDSP